jgi:hypothetical protein
MTDTEQKSRATPTRLFAAFTVVMLALVTFPIYGLANSVEPMILGLPFSMAWVIFWILVEFAALIAFYQYEFAGTGARAS